MFQGIPRKEYSTGFNCDGCKILFKMGKSFFHCYKGGCSDNYDLCLSCKPKISHQHPLRLYTGNPRTNPEDNRFSKNIVCDGCKKKCKNHFFNHKNVDYCYSCYEKKVPSNNNFTFFMKKEFIQMEISKRRDLELKCLPRSEYNRGFVCNGCRESFVKGKPFFHCGHYECSDNFDYCLKCYFRYKHPHKMKLYSGTPILTSPYKQWGGIRCDGCKTKSINRVFHKDPNYDLCVNCYSEKLGYFSGNVYSYHINKDKCEEAKKFIEYGSEKNQVPIWWWKEKNGKLPRKALIGGRTNTGESLGIGRVIYKGKQMIGKIHPSHRCLYVPFNGKEISFKEYHAFCVNNESKNVKWVNLTNKVPPFAIFGGYNDRGRKVYIARVNFKGDLLPGRYDHYER